MKLFISSLLFLSLFALSAYPQAQNVYFIKDDGSYVSTKDSADYIRVITESDPSSTIYSVVEYYKNGNKKSVGSSTSAELFRPDGSLITYYSNGKKKSIENYINGQPTGLQYAYYPNGKLHQVVKIIKPDEKEINIVLQETETEIVTSLDSTGKELVTEGNGHYVEYTSDFKSIRLEGDLKNGKRIGKWIGSDRWLKAKYTEQYDENGMLISGESIDAAGQKHSYTKRVEPPEYPGGMSGIRKYLEAHIRYPASARNNGIEGTVLIFLTVKVDGTVGDVKVLKPVSNDIDREAVRVVSRMKGWIPGKHYGIIADTDYKWPVAFGIR